MKIIHYTIVLERVLLSNITSNYRFYITIRRHKLQSKYLDSDKDKNLQKYKTNTPYHLFLINIRINYRSIYLHTLKYRVGIYSG